MTRQRAIFKRRKAARSEETILSFKLGYINLMITLVPFLLSIAVFSRLAVLDLHLPKLSSQGGGASSPRRLALTVEIEERGIAVSDGPERLAFFSRREGGVETEPLSSLMQKLKKDHPAENEIVILSRPNIPYEDLISVIDACRLARPKGGPAQILFHDISLGEVS